ncbi:MAG: hypothetical protein BWX46_00489 [Candidatus Cloacimonetes bacterium ADurb.Bin003]|nr:MAG: hypothetical protein BWX46_00489 [Candidatus Cloacimonetes bacterium ADurb.Bin003]
MNPEHRVHIIVKDIFVKFNIFFIFHFVGFTVPKCFFLVYLFAFKHNWIGHKITVSFQNISYFIGISIFRIFFIQVNSYGSSNFFALSFTHNVFRTAVTFPESGFTSFRARKRIYSYFIGNHKSRIKSQSKMANHIVLDVLVFINKILGTRKGNLIDVFLYFLNCHSNSGIHYFYCFFAFIQLNFYFHILFFEIRIGIFALGYGIYRIGNQFS